ncbi:MAG: hypothetical protein AAFQ35_10045 [Pseudomonadota bacterium]
MSVSEVLALFLPVPWEALGPAERVGAVAAISQTVAAILSLFAILLSLWVFARQQRLGRWQLRVQRDDNILHWAHACIGIMAEVEQRVSADEGAPPASVAAPVLSAEAFIMLRARLSSLIDEGRLYFPNVQSKTHGIDKHGAYRGHRQPILDPLVAFYDCMAVLKRSDRAADAPVASAVISSSAVDSDIAALNGHRREFVTWCQTKIDPRLFNRIRA